MPLNLYRPHVLQIASKDNHVCMLRVDGIYGCVEQIVAVRRISAHVCIRELHYTVAVECRREVGGSIVYLLHHYLVEPYGRAVYEHIPVDCDHGKAHMVAEIPAHVQPLLQHQAHHRAQGKDEVGHHEQPEQEQIEIERCRVCRRKVGMHGQNDGEHGHAEARKPPQHAHPHTPETLAPQVAQVDIQAWEHYHQQ